MSLHKHTKLVEQITTKLTKCSMIATRKGIPIILFRNTIEEAESSITEELAIMVGNYIIAQIYSYGGFIPVSFHHICILRPNEFVIWLMKRERELLLQCVDNLNAILS